jgi:hypothetical protein
MRDSPQQVEQTLVTNCPVGIMSPAGIKIRPRRGWITSVELDEVSPPPVSPPAVSPPAVSPPATSPPPGFVENVMASSVQDGLRSRPAPPSVRPNHMASPSQVARVERCDRIPSKPEESFIFEGLVIASLDRKQSCLLGDLGPQSDWHQMFVPEHDRARTGGRITEICLRRSWSPKRGRP